LLAVGREEAFTRLVRKVRPGFRIDFRERVGDDLMAWLFSLADVFISTSGFEGGNSPSLEVMACSIPVVVYRALWNEDFIINQGNTKNALMSRGTDEFLGIL
jgi:glycosyltransferase involved in cell wall biosynthesis